MKKQNLLIVKLQSVLKNKNDLFDYESNDVQTKIITINKDCFFARGEMISQYSTYEDIPPTESMISYVSYMNNSFHFETHYKEEEIKEKAWLPIMQFRTSAMNKTENYIIHQGDVLKFGRIEVKIRDICIEGKKSNSISNAIKSELGLNTLTHNHLRSSTTIDIDHKKECRICFCYDNEESPLINPCHCSGGIKYVHLNCLQLWVKTKRILRSSTNDNCIVYTYKNLECELCKAALPDLVQCGDNYYEICDFIEPEFQSYIIFETVSPLLGSQSTNAYKTIFIVNFNRDNQIRIGRSHDSDLRIKDLSVSRLHAEITITKTKEIMINDLNSKFGTIVLIQNQKLPIYQSPLTIQFGKNIIIMNLKLQNKISTLFKCYSCTGNTQSKLIDYNQLNSEEIRLVKSFTIKEEKIDNEACFVDEGRTQALGNDSDNKKTNSNSIIEKEIEIKAINNLFNDFGLKIVNEYYFENKKRRYKQLKKNSKRKLVQSITYTKKFQIDSENYYYDEIKTVKSLKVKGKNNFAEDF